MLKRFYNRIKKCWKRIRWEYLERFNPDKLELTEEVKKMIEEAEKDIKEGRLLTHEEVFGKEKDESTS